MTRNQKIALGCGGAGCLGLIVVAIAGCVIYLFSRSAVTSRTYNYNIRNLNTNYNSNSKENANTNSNENSSSSSSATASSISEDDKHKLYQAAGMTGDAELIRRVSVKIGLMDEDYTPGEDYQKFISEHLEWASRNVDFVNSINTPEKARAYVNEHFPD
ncbi:MAG TPA: hypothetical protein VJ875_20780 [Pyrinomonadaceae bacterium]|nr:hypothetical protein [Pyrinomonadaceae bacterium]